ncbi:response regulator [Sulfurimonas sp. SAG-AH-194-L11]|nr:ATP-binding protein [Sulfurimonas sp. SAG-AH-194-L11]MDF1876533.1 response regulator [Sulfurimonas sp. SAG-AH-194-L11]
MMLKSLKVRFILVIIFVIISIVALSIVQNRFSTKVQNLYESQLALKELQIKYLQMRATRIEFLLNDEHSYIADVEVYANTIDLYFSIIDEYLEEFHYPEEIKISIENYLQVFKQLGEHKNHKDIKLLKKLSYFSEKIRNYIQNQQALLIPLVSEKIEYIFLIQNIVFLVVALFIIFLLFIVLAPIIRSIVFFKKFFSEYTNLHNRLNVHKLYFTEVKEIGVFVNKMLESQEKTQKVKDEFLSNMSHELRTPLNAISGFAGVLQRKLPHESKIIIPIIESSEHLLQLVSDILDLSKIQSGKFKIVKSPFVLQEELNHFKEYFKPLMQKKNIDFSLTYKGDTRIELMGDWFRISQILNNFISNALKFTPENGKIALDVSYKNSKLIMSVKDNGIGIKKESLEKIMIPFEQSNDDISKEYGGTGLGLSIAKTLTEMMDGDFKIESDFGKGSTFSISLPLQVMHMEVTASKEEKKFDENISFTAHVLIAEDNKTNQLLLGMLLDDIGITFDVADDGAIAVEKFKEGKYDLILMDENMPNMDGSEAMLMIRKYFKNVPPIIAVTANAMKGDRERLLEMGMDDFLSKPIDNNLLIEIIRNNLK